MKDLSGLEVKDYFRILWNRRWYFLIVFALVSIGGIVNARLKPDIYRAEAIIAVDSPLSAGSSQVSTINERIAIFREHISSRTFIERMIQQTGLYGWGDNDNFFMDRAVASVKNNLKIQPTTTHSFKISYNASDPHMAQNVTRQFMEEVIRVSKRSTTDRAMTLDRFAEEKFAEATKKIEENSEKMRQFKMRNAGKLPEQTIANMNAISGYRAQLSAVENAISQANSEKEQLIYRHDADKKIRDEIARINASTVSTVPPSVTPRDASPEERELAKKIEALSAYEAKLANALNKYTENHPDVVALKREVSRLEHEIEEAWAKMPVASTTAPVATTPNDAAKPSLTKQDLYEEKEYNDYMRQISKIDATIAKRENERTELLRTINEYESRLKITPTLQQELDDLLREEALLKKEYESYANQKLAASKAIAIETDKDNEVYRVVDNPILPSSPIWPNRVQLIWMSLVGGFVLGIVASFGRELLDNTIGGEEEAKKIFNLPVLAVIPLAPKKNKKRK